MQSIRTAVTRVGVALAAATAVGAGLLAVAAPAHASVSDADAAAPISRQLVVERALSWVDESVPYSQSAYWPAGAPGSGIGHSYRTDCSGFVSMAWDLTGSAVTGDFVSSSSPYDAPLSSWDQLEPGDLLGVSGHVILFLGWSDNDHGAHRYFDMVSQATSGTNASVQRSQDRQGYWKGYTAYRYKNVVDDAPQSVSWGSGRVDQVTLDASGDVQHRSSTDGAAWATEDLTAAHGFTSLRTGLTIASPGTGLLDVFGVGRDGMLVDLHLDGTTWTQHEYASASSVTGLAAAGSPGKVELVGRQHASNDVDGTLVTGTYANGTWSGWTTIPGSPAVVDDPAAVRADVGHLYVTAENHSGALSLGTLTTAGWAWTSPFGSTRVALRPALAALNDGALVLTVTGAGVLQADGLAPGASAWSGFTTVGGTPTARSAPGWASAGAELYVFVETADGTIGASVRSTTGVWTWTGSAAPDPSSEAATTRTSSRTLNRS